MSIMLGNIYTTDVNYSEVICNVDIEYQVKHEDIEILGVKVNRIKAMSGSLINYNWLDEHNWLVPLEERLYEFLTQNLWKLYLWDDLYEHNQRN